MRRSARLRERKRGTQSAAASAQATSAGNAPKNAAGTITAMPNSIPPNTVTNTGTLLFTACVSVVQSYLGNFTFSHMPAKAMNAAKTGGVSSSAAQFAAPACILKPKESANSSPPAQSMQKVGTHLESRMLRAESGMESICARLLPSRESAEAEGQDMAISITERPAPMFANTASTSAYSSAGISKALCRFTNGRTAANSRRMRIPQQPLSR